MKKVSCFLLVVALLLMMYDVNEVSASDFSITSDYNVTGYTTRKEVKVLYNCKQPESGTILTNTVVGITHVYLGSCRGVQKTDNGDYYDAIMVKCAMNPQTFKNTEGKIVYGFSQFLQLSATLPSHAEYQCNSPRNSTIGSSSYSVSVGAGYKSADMSASVNMKSSYCEVMDYSDISKSLFNVAYDYKANLIDGNSNSERNIMLFNQTWQLASCEWTTAQSSYHVILKVYTKYGVSSTRNGIGMYYSLYDFSSYRTNYFGANYY